MTAPSVPPPTPLRAAAAELRAHQDWLGFVQPVGLVVSLPALDKAQCYVNRNLAREQQTLRSLSTDGHLPHLRALAHDVLGWEDGDLVEPPDSLLVPLPEYGEVLRPTWAVPEAAGGAGFQALAVELPPSLPFDKPRADTGWQASPQARLERLLRESGVPVGLLWNGDALRLVYAPRGESSGHLTFHVAEMCESAGRPILGGLRALLEADRLFNLPEAQRLPAILKDSRRYQNEVSTALAEQVLDALHALLRGLSAAHEATRGKLLQEVIREAPADVYGGLLATLLRLVFFLYAEDRSLLAVSPVYVRHYAVTALFEKLRDDATRFPDGMDQRFGAWARLLTLFRLVHDGGGHGALRLPPRYGRLFDPDAYPFLEGRPHRSRRVVGERLDVPRVSDGVVYRVLDKLLLLRGERLSYRALDVEQIGSVYEAMMGFALDEVTEPSIGVRPHHVVVGLASLVKLGGAERLKKLAEDAGCKVTGKAQEAVKLARTPEELLAALGKLVSPRTPEVLPVGTLVLQPTEERRRSGSHYTPRALTEPIVATTLRPIFEAMGADPTPGQILELKVCDPAMGSGAFLVAVCRVLGDKLVEAWQRHPGAMPKIPLDEDAVLHARRLVAQRCLYGVDKNPFAVDLAKLSLWLVTLAKDHPFTFLDHALRHGDSLVGLSREQIASFHWAPEKQVPILRAELDRALTEAEGLRARIHALGDSDDVGEKTRLYGEAEGALRYVRYAGDQVVEAFFEGKNDKERKAAVSGAAERLVKPGEPIPEHEGQAAFHWEIEFPEVFSRENPGFDAFVGNPPFLGGKRISTVLGDTYKEWLTCLHESSNSNSDLVAHFFRRAFAFLRNRGTFGLLATNTVAQGDTRATGLRWLRLGGGVIYDATRRHKWPGNAAVVTSIVHVQRNPANLPTCRLDDHSVGKITAFLFHQGSDDNPAPLAANADKSFIGYDIKGQGFLFDDEDEAGTPLAAMRKIIANERNRERIFPYLGGEELNTSPAHVAHRFAINFAQMREEEARLWPELMAIVETKVKPYRDKANRDAHRIRWWQYGDPRPGLTAALAKLPRALCCSLHSKDLTFVFVDAKVVPSHALAVIVLDSYAALAALQSRLHEVWARVFGSSLEDRLRYTPTDCFETFPFPPAWQQSPTLEAAGDAYYTFRASLMANEAVRASLMASLPPEGLTSTYNRFHDPDETLPGILRLRELHAAMDRAVLDAYGWGDLVPTCAFLLDYEEEEDDDDARAGKKKRKPWRYRWPDEVRDEVLARLLALNAERAAEERLLGAEAALAAEAGKPKKAAKPRAKGPKKPAEGQGGLFG